MARTLVIYCKVHQPLPLRLPATEVPPKARPEDLEHCLFNLPEAEHAFRELVAPSYRPALDALNSLAEQGISLSVGVSSGFLRLAGRWAPSLLAPMQSLMCQPNVEAVCEEPTDGLLSSFDIAEFMCQMGEACTAIEALGGARVVAAEVNGFSLSKAVYHALARLGFNVVLAETAHDTPRGHQPGYPARWGEGPVVLHRLRWLSEEFAYRLRGGPPEPERMADTVTAVPGEVAVLTFDLDALALGGRGVAHGAAVIASLAAACEARHVDLLTTSPARERALPHVVDEPPPTLTTGMGIAVERFGRDGWWERLLFGRMQRAYQMIRLIEDAGIRDVGVWLLQRANLELPGWAAEEAARPATYRWSHWWEQPRSHDETATQVLAAYDNFIRVADSYLERGQPA